MLTADTVTDDIERMTFDFPSVPWSMVKAEITKIQGSK